MGTLNNNYKFYKNKKSDKIWWVENSGKVGEWLFPFNKEKIFNMFRDYPNALSKEEKDLFDKENPYWADFFKERTL